MINQTKQSTLISNSDDRGSSTTAERLQALHEFARSGANDPHLFISAALDDKDDEVRCTAITYLGDLPTLKMLLKQKGSVKDAASLQYHKIIAGSLPSTLSAEDRLHAIESLNPKSVKQVALLAKCKEAATAALSRIEDSQDLADLCLFAATVYVRKTAAEKMDDVDLINELMQKTEGKDKTVFKVLSNKTLTIKKGTKPEVVKQVKQTIAANDSELVISTVAKKEDDPVKPLHKPVTEKERLEVAARFNDLSTEISDFYSAISKLSIKNTGQLNKQTVIQKKLKQKINWPDSLPPANGFEEFLAQEKHLINITGKNRSYQSKLAASSSELIELLKTALDEGKSNDASRLWDKIQGNIGNTGGQIHRELTQKTNEFKTKLSELKDWKNFAETQKKKELIAQMQHLLEAKMHPSDKSKHISKLHREWKLLGHSSQNERLWRQFKTSSDQAFEPCREFFKQQKQVMANNLKQRIQICEQMEAYLETIDHSVIDLVSIKKVEAKARDEWKLYAPVENSKIKKLQKRFYAIMDKLRKIKRSALHISAESKKTLIVRAEELIDLEDNREAMNQAKLLQSEWKKIGPSSYKDDRKYWEAFRAACDKIFAKRDIENQKARNEIVVAIKEVNQSLNELDGILNQNEEAFRESRKLLSSVQRNFRDALSPKIKKERKQLLVKFDNIVGKIETRFRKLPNKKLQQAKAALSEKATICLQLETNLLACENEDDLCKATDKIDDSQWENLQLCANKEFDEAMDNRFQSLRKIASIKQFLALTKDTESEARNKIVELEIKANLDSPESDKGLRMQVQLNQLKTNFGRTTDNNHSKFARDFELAFLCFGPLDHSVREEMERRVEKAVDKLI